MASYTQTTYHCDHCEKKLKYYSNSLDIMTTKRDGSIGWSRLNVKVEHHHGSHNDEEVDQAELCKKCAIELLEDALKRVRKGERATKGTESSDEEGWG